MNVNLNDTKIQNDLKNTIKQILIKVGVYEEDLVYLDYNFKFKNNFIKLTPNNFVCALWFIGALPEDTNIIFEENKAIVGGYLYRFNQRTKKLSKRKLKN
jgi:hypothetical protein